MKKVLATYLAFGRYPDKPGIGSSDKLLSPGEKVEIALTAKDYDDLQAFLKSRSFNNINSLRLVLDSVIFDDDTQWFGGELMRRDPNNPNRWAPIGKL